MSAAAAVGFPKWVLLEPYVFRIAFFPDDTQAPFRASGTTSWGADFRIAFSLAEPPSISRLYAHLPGFPGPDDDEPLQMLATHRHLFLLCVGIQTPSEGVVEDFFIFRADENKPSSSSLTALPPCTVPRHDRSRIRPGRPPSNTTPHLLDTKSLGLWCGDKEEFVVAELTLFVPTCGRTKAFADICLLRSSFTDDQLAPCKWHTMRVPIPSTTDDELLKKLAHWQTDAVIPFQRWLCWIDYHQGILFWDVSKNVPAPTISFLGFPLDKYPCAITFTTPCSGNGAVTVVDDGRLLKFAYVARQDGCLAYGAPKPGTGFTITCHTLVLGGSMKWKEDYTVTSDDLRDHHLHHGLPLYPRVDIVRPQVVHSLYIEFGKAYKKMSVLSINMSSKTVESFYLYMDGNEFLQPCPTTVDIDFIKAKSTCGVPAPFLPCEFLRFRHCSRKKKDME